MGDLKITIVEAKDLIAADSNGKSDPYVTIALKSDPKRKHKTSTKDKTLSPKWGEIFEFVSPKEIPTVELRVFDHDRFGKDDPLGVAELFVETLEAHILTDVWLLLQHSGARAGQIRVQAIWRPTGTTPGSVAAAAARPAVATAVVPLTYPPPSASGVPVGPPPPFYPPSVTVTLTPTAPPPPPPFYPVVQPAVELKAPAPPVAVAAAPLRFFNAMATGVPRNYILVVDKSGSMAGGRWREAKNAVSKIAPAACKADPDGISLVFFSNGPPTAVKNVRTAADVDRYFTQNKPGGTTDLAGVLDFTLKEHFADPTHTPTTILVVTDGEPNDSKAVRATIIAAANRINADIELSISFIQVGNDRDASQFLKLLDDELTCKYDIVDTLSYQQMQARGLSFEQIIALSVHD